MLKTKLEGASELTFVNSERPNIPGFRVVFQRTLRIPDDGKTYPLPPGLGAFPIRRVLDYKDRVPESWVKTSGVFIPMYQREAMWISFKAREWRPNAVKIAAGKINAVSGKPWDQKLAAPIRRAAGRRPEDAPADLQDYLVCPPQPWIDGFNTGDGTIRQFVAVPLGMGYTVEGQVTGKEEYGGLQIMVFEPRPGHFREEPGPPPLVSVRTILTQGAPMAAAAPMAARDKGGREMGLAAGGTIKQKIYSDPHGIDVWDPGNTGRVFVHIVNSLMWRRITGEAPPSSPVDATTYTQAGYPWFKMYDEGQADVAASPVLANVKSVAEMDAAHGFVGLDDNESIPLAKMKIKDLAKNEVPDGDW